MDLTGPPTNYARLRPAAARRVLLLVVLAAMFCVGVSVSPLAQGFANVRRGPSGDMALYHGKLVRMQQGEGYYSAAGTEMRARGYPTRSVFNWRIPLPFWVLGAMPEGPWGKTILGLLSVGLMLAAFETVAREDSNRVGRAALAALLLTGPLMLGVLGKAYVMPTLWGGVLVALSICAYGVGRPGFGVAAGLLALFWRELTMPYALVAIGLAWWNGRRKELAAWAVGLGCWAVYFGIHWLIVADLTGPADRAHENSWIQFGGAGFVISAVQVNAYLLLLPQWVAALYFVAAMVGFAGWNTPLGMRAGLTAAGFVLAFSIVGQDINQYWGTIVGPLLCLGVARFPASLHDLYRASQFGRFPSPARG
jgi:hypothetical protein